MIEASILSLLDFEKLFSIEYDASAVEIGWVLSQEGQPIAFFSEKLNDAKKKYGTSDKEIYVIVETLKQWRHNLLYREIIIFIDNQALKYINS